MNTCMRGSIAQWFRTWALELDSRFQISALPLIRGHLGITENTMSEEKLIENKKKALWFSSYNDTNSTGSRFHPHDLV